MKRAWVTLLLAGAACGGSLTTDAKGQFNGAAFEAADATIFTQREGAQGVLTLWIAERANFCAFVTGGATLNHTRFAIVSLGIVAPDGELVPGAATGKFEIGVTEPKLGSKLAAASFYETNLCGIAATRDATSGTIEITHMVLDADGNAKEAAGTVSLQFANGFVAGSFSVGPCNLAHAGLDICVN